MDPLFLDFSYNLFNSVKNLSESTFIFSSWTIFSEFFEMVWKLIEDDSTSWYNQLLRDRIIFAAPNRETWLKDIHCQWGSVVCEKGKATRTPWAYQKAVLSFSVHPCLVLQNQQSRCSKLGFLSHCHCCRTSLQGQPFIELFQQSSRFLRS